MHRRIRRCERFLTLEFARRYAMKKEWAKPVATETATSMEVTSYMEAELEDELLNNK